MNIENMQYFRRPRAALYDGRRYREQGQREEAAGLRTIWKYIEIHLYFQVHQFGIPFLNIFKHQRLFSI